jgi:methylenetetrahydrofolate reductase (NADPH)
VDEIEDCKTNEQARQASVKWCIQQSQELIEAGVPVLHYYSMGKARSIKEIAEEVFGS